jgi:Tfp pilus assembly protein PilN
MVVGLLGTALVLVTLYVLASNSVTSRQAQLASLRQQLSQTQALANSLTGYTKFAQLAQARVQTVREIANSRFDWQRVLSDLSKVVPTNTTLSSLTATVSPSASAGAASGSGGLRADLSDPAFELAGCTSSQDDVARVMSRLRLINGVVRVTLASAVKSATGAAGSAVTSSSGAGGCRSNASSFDVVVFFQPPAGSSAAVASTSPTAPATGTTTTATTSTTSTTPATPSAGGGA